MAAGDTGKTLTDVVDQLAEVNKSISKDKSVKVLTKMLNLQIKTNTLAAEAAAEASRGGDDPDTVPDSKVEEAKAGGFFSKMGRAVMNPIGAMGRSMKSAGKGISGFLKGLASGLAAFANPMVLLGVTVLSLSLPIFAAGLAAAFKVFELIAGEGKALEFVTGIIESLGEAIGTILHKVLSGFGEMVKRMGPFITTFFNGLAVVVEALTPIVKSLFKLIKDIITDPVLNKTMQAVIAAISSAISDVKEVLVAFAPVIKSIITDISVVIVEVAGKIEAIVATIGSVIEKILGSFDNVVNSIRPIIEEIGTTISSIVTSIGDSITKVIGSVSSLITAIGKTVEGVIDTVVSGIERLAGLSPGNMLGVAAGLIAIGAGLVVFTAGAAVAGGFMPSSAELETVAKSIEKFGAIDATNLSGVGTGMQAVGVGLLAFGAGGALASLLNDPTGLEGVASSVSKFGAIDATNFAMVGGGITALGKGLATFGAGGLLAGISEGIGKFFGASDPVEKFQRFAAIGPGLNQAALGITGLAQAMNVLGNSNIGKTADALDKFMGNVDMEKLTAFSKATEGLMTGQMLANLQIESKQNGGGQTTIINNNTNSSIVGSSAIALPASGVSPSNGDVMNVRIIN